MCDSDIPNYPGAGSAAYDILAFICSIMIFIYSITLCFNFHNVYLYLILQKRYKTWLITIFYVLSETVLISRITYYAC